MRNRNRKRSDTVGLLPWLDLNKINTLSAAIRRLPDITCETGYHYRDFPLLRLPVFPISSPVSKHHYDETEYLERLRCAIGQKAVQDLNLERVVSGHEIVPNQPTFPGWSKQDEI